MALTTNQAIADQVSLAYFGRPQDTGALAIFGAGLVNGSPTAAQLATQFATAESKVVFGALSTMSSVIAKSFELVGRVATSQNVTDLSTWATANNLAVSQMPWEIMKIALATESLLPQASQVAWARLAVAYQFSEDVTANSTALQNLATSTTSQDAARAVINGVTSFATIATAYPATGSGTVANFITGTSVVAGQTFTLTTGIDTGTAFTGTAGNDTFVAVDNAAGTSNWGALDQINGGLGNDTFSLATAVAIVNPAAATVTGIETMNVTNSGAAVGVVLNTTTFTGLTALNVNTVQTTAGGATAVLTAAATTDVTLTNSVANATAGALTVNGGKNVTVTGTGAAIVVGGAAATAPAGTVTVTNTAQAANNVAVNSGTDVSVTTTGQTTGTVIVGSAALPATGAVNVTVGGLTTAATTGLVTVVGGSSITIRDIVVNSGVAGAVAAVTGNIIATGSAVTTSASVTQAAQVTAAVAVGAVANTSNVIAAISGVTNGTVTVADVSAGSTTVANTLTSVTLNNYGASTITSTALKTVNLSGTGSTLSITEGGSAATIAANTALALNLGGGSLGVITDVSNQFATVNAVLAANTTLAGVTDTALRTLNVSGTGVLALTASNAALTGVTVAGAAGFSGTLVGTGVTSFTAANTTANNTVTLTSTTQTYTGGTGNDTVSIAADATKVISGGAGNDTLVLSGTAATYTAANTVANVTGFENLSVTNIGGGIYDMSVLTGFTSVGVNVAGSTTTFDKVAGTVLNLDTGSTAVIYKVAGTSGATGSVTVNLNGTAANPSTTTLGFTTTALTLTDQNAVGLGTVNIVSNASVGGGVHTISTLTDANLANLNISGTGSLIVTNAATTSTGLVLANNNTSTAATTISTLTSTGNVLGNLSYSGTHAAAITLLVDNVANLTITNANTGTAGVLTVGGHTNTNAALASLNLNGAIAYTGVMTAATGAATVSGATNNQIVNLTMAGATGAKTITLGNGANVIVTGAAADVITLGSGANTVTGAAGGDKITFAAHATGIVDNVIMTATAQTFAVAANSGWTSGVTALTGIDVLTGMKAGDTITMFAGATITAATVINTAALALAATSTVDALAIVRGNYVASTGIFTTSTTGTDSILSYDADGTTGGANSIESIILVGFTGTLAAGANLLTLV